MRSTFPVRRLRRPALEVAPMLLGARLTRRTRDGVTSGIVVETEAYNQDDPASHCFNGKTKRNAVMFEPGGLLYVYFTYGMHFCMNVVTGPAGRGEAVLVRALEPVDGVELMAKRRGTNVEHLLTSGPARLTQAMDVDRALDGHDLLDGDGELVLHPPRRYAREEDIVKAKRIGIRKAKNKRWRFYLANNAFVSKRSLK